MRKKLKNFFKNMNGKIIEFFREKNSDTEDDPEKEDGPTVVEIVRHVTGREPVIFVRCELVGEKVILTGVEENKDPEEIDGVRNILRSLERGIFSAAEKGDVSPKDGQKFLEALIENYDHPYLLARVKK